ncbi:MAG: hypothetical protein RIQ54_366 [Candidatus Parcubacteria bacterium]|jgi:hypothetical protein
MEQLHLFPLITTHKYQQPDEKYPPTILQELRKEIEKNIPKHIIQSIGFQEAEDGRKEICVELTDMKYQGNIPKQWGPYRVTTERVTRYYWEEKQ